MSLYFEGTIQHEKAHVALCVVVAEDGSESRYTINVKHLKKAIHGDIVLIKSTDGKHGFVQRVIKNANAILSGKLSVHPSGKYGYVKPWSKYYHKDFYVDLTTQQLNYGDIVEIETIRWFKSSANPLAKLLRKVYTVNPQQEVIYTLNLPVKFPKPVLEEVSLGNYMIEKDEQRIDLTHVNTFSFNEYYSCQNLYSLEHTPQGYRVGVHTVDATSYIKAGSAVDQEAYARGTTYNLEGTSVPMLPELLAYDKLSFVANKNRYALSFIINLDVNWNVVDHYFFPSIVKNKSNISTQVADTLLDDSSHHLYPVMSLLSTISTKLVSMFHNGYPQVAEKVLWDKDAGARIKTVSKTEETLSNLRLVTNIIATRHIERASSKMIYRTPRRITEERVLGLREKLTSLGCVWQDEFSSSANVCRILKSNNRLAKDIIQHNLLPSMYMLSNTEAGVELYTHVTSPTTCYADLVNQRILSAILLNKPVRCGDLDVVVEHLQKVHKKEISAQRYMQQSNMNSYSRKIQRSMDAVVIAVNKKGIFVKTDMLLTGFVLEPTKEYQVGDTLSVKIVDRTENGIKFQTID